MRKQFFNETEVYRSASRLEHRLDREKVHYYQSQYYT